MPLPTEAIRSFLQYGDYSLALRRMLDLALDISDKTLLTDTIAWSRQYAVLVKEQPVAPDDFLTSATALLARMDAFPAPVFQPALLLDAAAISKKYRGSSFSLHPISIKVQTGDIWGIVGENGQGKTTLLSCLSGDLAIDAGSIHYPQLNEPDFYTIKHTVAFIPQRIPVWYGLLKDNLHFAASLAGLKGAENELMVDFMLERLHLTAYAHLTWKQISSGYRTRFEIARVLLQKPSLLVLDEPLANLDIHAQQTLLTDLRYMAKSVHHPMGILLSSQQLHEVEKVADAVLLIKGGHCIFQTNTQTATTETVQYVIELESTASREAIAAAAGNAVQVQYNGGFYTLHSSDYTAQELLHTLINAGIDIQYFRDITHSTKRYF